MELIDALSLLTELIKRVDWQLLWNLVNSELVVAFVIWQVARAFNRYEERTAKVAERTEDIVLQTEDLKQMITFIEEARYKEDMAGDQTRPAASVAADGPDYRDEAAAIIHDSKRYLDIVAETTADGRYKRALRNIPRYDYVVLAIALHKRNLINTEQLSAATSLFAKWRKYATGLAATRPVSQNTLESLQGDFEILTKRVG